MYSKILINFIIEYNKYFIWYLHAIEILFLNEHIYFFYIYMYSLLLFNVSNTYCNLHLIILIITRGPWATSLTWENSSEKATAIDAWLYSHRLKSKILRELFTSSWYNIRCTTNEAYHLLTINTIFHMNKVHYEVHKFKDALPMNTTPLPYLSLWGA